jgi:hypothetical protein
MKNATLHWVDFNEYFADTFCLDYEGDLVITGNFFGVHLLVKATEETGIDQIRDDLAEEFAMEPTAFQILRYGKNLHGKLARDVGRAGFPTSVDFMVQVLGGMGKRARASKDAENRNDVLDSLKRSIDKELRNHRGEQVQELVSALNKILLIRDGTEQTTDERMQRKAAEIHRVLNACDDEQLKLLNSNWGSGQNKNAKVSCFKNIVFAQELKDFKALTTKIDDVKALMEDTLCFMVTKSASNESGDVNWTALQSIVVDTIKDRAVDAMRD